MAQMGSVWDPEGLVTKRKQESPLEPPPQEDGERKPKASEPSVQKEDDPKSTEPTKPIIE